MPEIPLDPEIVAEARLVSDALGGSQPAFEQIVRRYQRPVISLIVRMTGDHAQAEDLAQETFVKAFRHLKSFDPARPLSVDWTRLGVFPFPRFVFHQLAALEDSAGFTLALGIITEIERDARRVVLHTPLRSLEGVTALRLGAMTVTPVGYQERHIDT